MSKQHFSPISQKWVPCKASVRPCKYGADSHRSPEQVKELKQNQILLAETAELNVVVAQFHDMVTHHSGANALQEATSNSNKANNAYLKAKKAVAHFTETEISSEFSSQLDSLEGSAEGKLRIGLVPSFEDHRDVVKKAPTELKESLGKSHIASYEADEKVRQMAYAGIQAS